MALILIVFIEKQNLPLIKFLLGSERKATNYIILGKY